MTRDEAVRMLKRHEGELRAFTLREPPRRARRVRNKPMTVTLEEMLAELPADERASIEERAKQLIAEEVVLYEG